MYVVVVLFRLLIGIAALAAAYYMAMFGLFAKIPRFIGHPVVVGEAVQTYWQGRVAMLVGAPLVGIVGIVSIGLAFTGGLSPEYYKNAAVKAANGGNFAKAARLMNTVVEKLPWDTSSLLDRATFRAKAGDREGALEDFAKAKEQVPLSAEPFTREACLFIDSGDTSSAMERLEQALAKPDPEQTATIGERRWYDALTDAYYWRGCLRLKSHEDLEGAAEDFAVCIARKKFYTRIEPDAKRRLVRLYRRLGQYESARSVLQSIGARIQLGFDYVTEYGMMLGAQGDWEKARATFEKGIQATKDRVYACNLVAWALATDPDERSRNGSLAIYYAERAVNESGRAPGYLDTLASAYAAAGEFGKAVRAEKEALENEGDQDYRNDYAARLKFFQARQCYTED